MSDTIRCPERACTGWICHIEETPSHTFWGCGECGMVWPTVQDRDADISQAIKKHPYRAACYISTQDGFVAAPLQSEAPNYADLVQSEWDN